MRASCSRVSLGSGLGPALSSHLPCVYVLPLWCSFGLCLFFFVFRVLVSFSSACPLFLTVAGVILPVIVPTSLREAPARRSLCGIEMNFQTHPALALFLGVFLGLFFPYFTNIFLKNQILE